MRTKTAIISIEDLTSESIPVLSQAFKALPGVEGVDFNLDRKVAVVEFDPAESNVDNLLRTVLNLGHRLF
jgi:hypothetical protein